MEHNNTWYYQTDPSTAYLFFSPSDRTILDTFAQPVDAPDLFVPSYFQVANIALTCNGSKHHVPITIQFAFFRQSIVVGIIIFQSFCYHFPYFP